MECSTYKPKCSWNRHSKRNAINFNPKTTLSDYLIICRYVYDTPELFITRIDENLKSKINTTTKAGKTSHWLEIRDYEPFKDNWDIIGNGFD